MAKQKIAKDEFDTIADSLSERVRINRLRKLYTIDEICEVLGYFDGSMSDEDEAKIDSAWADSPEQREIIYKLAVNNGNFVQAIAMNTYLPI